MATGLITEFIGQGLAASRPATPDVPTGALAFYFATDTETLSLYDANDAAWQTIGGAAALADGDYGDVTVSGSGTVINIDANAVGTSEIANSAVTLAKIANAAANSKLLGAGAAGSGAAYVELTLGTNLSMSGTTLNAAGGGSSGTSFPGSPATDDVFYRTDRRIEYFYDGTRWLSTQLHTLPIAFQTLTNPLSISGSHEMVNPWWGDYDIYVEKGKLSTWSTTTTVANYFTCQFRTYEAAVATNLGSSASLQNDTQAAWINRSLTINTVVASTVENIALTSTETGTSITYVDGALVYRLVG